MTNEAHPEQIVDDEDALAPPSVVDASTFGRRLRALRVLHGFDRATDFVTVLRGRYGIDISDRTLYAIERGEQMPQLDFTLACVAILTPPLNYFQPCIRADVWKALMSGEERL